MARETYFVDADTFGAKVTTATNQISALLKSVSGMTQFVKSDDGEELRHQFNEKANTPPIAILILRGIDKDQVRHGISESSQHLLEISGAPKSIQDDIKSFICIQNKKGMLFKRSVLLYANNAGYALEKLSTIKGNTSSEWVFYAKNGGQFKAKPFLEFVPRLEAETV